MAFTKEWEIKFAKLAQSPCGLCGKSKHYWYGAFNPGESDCEKAADPEHMASVYGIVDKDAEIAKLKSVITTLRRLNPSTEQAFEEGMLAERRRWEGGIKALGEIMDAKRSKSSS